MTIEKIYQDYIYPLPVTEQLRLITLISQHLTNPTTEMHSEQIRAGGHQYSIMELHGLGAVIWQGVDTETYVNDLRNEWEQSN